MNIFTSRYSGEEDYKSTACDLHLLMGPLHLQIMVLDKEALQIHELVSFQFSNDSMATQGRELKNLFDSDAVFQKRFKSVTTWVFSPFSVLCPEELFRQTESKVWANFYFPEKEIEHRTVRNLLIPAVNARILYLGSEVFEKLMDKFAPGLKVAPIQLKTIEFALHAHESESNSSVYIFIYGYHFEVIVKQGEVLKYYNVFSYTTEADFIFYLMHTLDAQQIDPLRVRVYLAGDINENSKVYASLLRYVKHVLLLERPKALRYTSALELVSKSFYFPLFLSGL